MEQDLTIQCKLRALTKLELQQLGGLILGCCPNLIALDAVSRKHREIIIDVAQLGATVIELTVLMLLGEERSWK